MNDTQTSDIQIFESLRNALGFFGDETNVIYKSKFVDKNTGFIFNSSDDLLNSLHEFGFQGKTLKEAGFELEDWYELLKQQQETITEVPRPTGPDATTLTSDRLENLGELRDRNKEVNSRIREREINAVKEYKKNIQRQINANKETQSELNSKKVWAKVEEIRHEDLPLTQTEQEKLARYREMAKNAPASGTDELAIEIEKASLEKLKAQGLTDEQIKAASRSSATTIINNLAKYELNKQLPATTQAAINLSIANNNSVISSVITNKAAQLSIRSAALDAATKSIYENELARQAATVIFGNATNIIFGQSIDNLKIELSPSPSPGFSNEINLGVLNKLGSIELQKKLTSIEDIVTNSSKGIQSLGVQTNLNFVNRRLDSLTETPINRRGLKNITPINKAIIVSDQSLNTTPKTQGDKTKREIQDHIDLREDFSVLLKKTYRQLTIKLQNSIDLPAIKKILSKQGIAIGGILALGALIIGGPTAGGTVFLSSLALTGNLGLFASQASKAIVSMMISIGSSIIIPIVGLIVGIPLIIAFIMLVINNSAYVVPPGPPKTASLQSCIGGTCPIPGGSILCSSLGSGIAACEHGNNVYWSTQKENCQWALPSSAGIRCKYNNIPGNVCYKPVVGALCPEYGYAADIWLPGDGCNTTVYFPSIAGIDIDWKKVTSFSGTQANGVYKAVGDSNVYEMYVTHLETAASSGGSGDVIGKLSCELSTPHVHIELKVNGEYIRPDILCSDNQPGIQCSVSNGQDPNTPSDCSASGPYGKDYEPQGLTGYTDPRTGRSIQVASEIVPSLTNFLQSALPKELTVYSGYRTYDEQLKLCEDCQSNKQKDPNYPCMAAPAAYSNHRTGYAVDMYILENGKYKDPTPAIINLGSANGFKHPISIDPPHFEFNK